MNEDRCVCCGAVIPEGRMVCPNCLVTVKAGECKYCKDEICVNADSLMRADYCPVPDDPGVCRYEERGADIGQ